jgi:hypothetical protein
VLTVVRGVPGIPHNGASNLRENMRFLHEESAVSPSRRTAGAYGPPRRPGILHNGTSNLLENMRLLHEESAVSPSRRTAGALLRP